jgi:hypothetical protein
MVALASSHPSAATAMLSVLPLVSTFESLLFIGLNAETGLRGQECVEQPPRLRSLHVQAW